MYIEYFFKKNMLSRIIKTSILLNLARMIMILTIKGIKLKLLVEEINLSLTIMYLVTANKTMNTNI